MEKYARFRYQPCVPLGMHGKCVTASKKHCMLSHRAATEGMVLLKNENNALPLGKGEKVALLGKATIEYIKGGGGSGEVYSPYIINVYEGMKKKEDEGKVRIFLPAIDFYKAYVEEKMKDLEEWENPDSRWNKGAAAVLPDSLIKAAAEFAQTAVITISRYSSEGSDRKAAPGDYYLSDDEKNLIDRAAKLFEKVVVVFDTGAVLDCEYLAENDKVQAVLFAWQAGLEGGAAIADILCGDVNPSGKLPDTVVKNYDSYPSKRDFEASSKYLNYSEDIYVGYRYFETVPGKRDEVRYPFGFGLSYTTFSISSRICGVSDGRVVASCSVKNTGDVAGKEVVQLYYSAPQGKLGKPAKELAAFKKTKLLAPGESETLAMSFDVNSMASFDDLGKITKSAYVLEKGKYEFYLGTSVRDCEKLDYTYEVADDTVTEQLSSWCKPFRLSRRMLSNGKYEKLPTGEEEYFYGKNKPVKAKLFKKEYKFDDVGEKITMDDFVRQLTLEELADIVGGKHSTGVANTGCFGGLGRLNVPLVPTADGPAGLRFDTKTGVFTTAWPCSTLLAATWNEDLIYEVGAAAGAETRENNIGVWLAPAMNIHRNPLCGRNFEYLSEDPLLAGKIAAAEVRGVQSQKAAVSIKHFACNNKENNRTNCDSRVSERALREIYLKAFEICVKEADPWTIMSSYNLINGQHTSESYELLTGILRNEWGFKGMVVTDWGVKNDPVKEVLAGNDMKMHVGYPEDLLKGIEDGRLTRADLELCTKRILELFTKLA